VAVSDATGHIVYEFMIPMGEEFDYQINPNEENESGMFTFTLDDPSNFDGYWPCRNQQIFLPEGYGSMAFGAVDEVPPPPDDVEIVDFWFDNNILVIEIEWAQPNINDFDHFNVYYQENTDDFVLLSETIGRQVFLVFTDYTDYMDFYITTVDISDQESDPSNIVQIFLEGIQEQPTLSNLEVYPNPFSNMATIKFGVEEPAFYDITLVDINGRIVTDILSGDLKAGDYVIPIIGNNINGKTLQNGVYLVKISNQIETITKKLILSR
nr:T9SS type A sorting domain-containing protein [Bacteroidota bacterium]